MLGNGTSVGARPRHPDNNRAVKNRIEDVKREIMAYNIRQPGFFRRMITK